MKKLFDEELLKKLFNRWGFVTQLEDDSSRYGSIDVNALVNNSLLGICRVSEIKELENKGAILYQYGKWRIKTKPIIVTSENKKLFHADRHIGQVINIPADAWIEYMDKQKSETTKLIEDDKWAFDELVAKENQ